MAWKIREVMTRDVDTLQPTDSVRDAAELMRNINVGVLPVCEEGRVVGVVTDRDLIVRAIALGHDPTSTPISEVMSANVQVCDADDDVGSVLERMKKQQLRRFIVADDAERLVGIVTLGDVAQAFSEQRVGEALEGISEPTPAAY